MLISKRSLRHLVVPVIVAMAFQVLPDRAFAKAKPAAKPFVKQTPKPVPKSPIKFSITSRIRRGQLVISLDSVPIFNEAFQKPAYLISQTTVWDPVQVSAGKHRLTARVKSANGKTYVSGTYELEVSPTKGIDLRIRMKGDTLTVEPVTES